MESNLSFYQPVILLHDQIALSRNTLSGLNKWLVKRQLLKRFGRLFIKSKLFTYIVDPTLYDYIKIFENEISIYDCLNELASLPGLSGNEQKNIIVFENKTVNTVDVVFTLSQELYNRRKKIKESVYYLPWAAEYKHFSNEMDSYKCADLLKHKKPRIGFSGNIWGIFDLDLVRHIAESLPECSIVLIGGLADIFPSGFAQKFKKICTINNIHWLGYKDHSVLPAYLHYFDVCIMPYKIDDWTLTCSPSKFFQYLAQGKPIVSVPIPEVMKFKDDDLVRIASSCDEFVDEIKNALSESPSENIINKRKTVAKNNSWDNRAQKMIDIIKAYGN
jgi:glycosyltransferase involved in cell wall biosynthesis